MNEKDYKETKLELLNEIEILSQKYEDTYFYCNEYKKEETRAFYINDGKFLSNEYIESFVKDIDYSESVYWIYRKDSYITYNNELFLEDMGEEYLKLFIYCIKNDRYKVKIVKDEN